MNIRPTAAELDAITVASLALAYGTRDTEQPCLKCGATVPATSQPGFGYETEDDQARPLCETCLALANPADHNALHVLRVIAEAAGRAPNTETAADFLWTLSQGVELLTEDLEERAAVARDASAADR